MDVPIKLKGKCPVWWIFSTEMGARKTVVTFHVDHSGAEPFAAGIQTRFPKIYVKSRKSHERRRHVGRHGATTLTNAIPRKRPFRQITRQSRSTVLFMSREKRSGRSSTLRAAVRRAPPPEISQRTQRTGGQ
jgi:hypothetical protein